MDRELDGARVNSDNTRDIVIQTRAEVAGLTRTLEAFVQESREHRRAVEQRLEEHQEIVNKARGAKWAVISLGAIFGFLSSYLPHPKF